MADRRMFSKHVTDSDVFLDMPPSTQNLYFHLGMNADDEGFISSPKKVMRSVNATQNELDILLSKRYLILFKSGVVVVKHWKLNNSIRKDRIKKTVYLEEKSLLSEKENGVYTLKPITLKPKQPDDNHVTTKCPHSIVEDSIVEDSIVEDSIVEDSIVHSSDKDIEPNELEASPKDPKSPEFLFTEADCDEIYSNYPRKQGKANGYKTLLKLKVKDHPELTKDQIVEGAITYSKVSVNTEKQYIKMFSTWINGRHWEDEYSEEELNPDPPQSNDGDNSESYQNSNEDKFNYEQDTPDELIDLREKL